MHPASTETRWIVVRTIFAASRGGLPFVLRWVASSGCQVMEIQTSADPAVLWLRARQLCYLGPKDGMPADLANSLKADEEDRKTDHAPLVVTENEEVATLTATIETNLQQGDLETRLCSFSGDQASSSRSSLHGKRRMSDAS